MRKYFFLFTFIFWCLSQKVEAQVLTSYATSIGYPLYAAMDANGNVYTSNYSGTSIYKTTALNTTSVFATLPTFSMGIAIDNNGNIYVSCVDNKIYKSTGGVFSVFADLSNTSLVITPAVSYPYKLIFDNANNLYVSEFENGTGTSDRIIKITPAGVVSTYASGLKSPNGFVFDASGNLFVTCYGDNKIQKITPSGTMSTFTTLSTHPRDIIMDGTGNFYVSMVSSTILKVTRTGTASTYYNNNNVLNSFGLMLDNAKVNLYWCSPGSSSVFQLNLPFIWNGSLSTDWTAANNWSTNAVPISTSDALIPLTSNQPIIGNGVSAIANSITIQSGGVLTLSGSGTLNATNGITVNPGAALVGNSTNVTGAVTLQQTVLGQRGWRVFANPFSTATTIATVASTNGITIGTSLPASGSGITDSRTYNNTGINAGTWSNVLAPTTTWASDALYSLFIRGLASEVTGLNYTSGPSPFIYNVSGTLEGTSMLRHQTAGVFSVCANPYAAPVLSLIHI